MLMEEVYCEKICGQCGKSKLFRFSNQILSEQILSHKEKAQLYVIFRNRILNPVVIIVNL